MMPDTEVKVQENISTDTNEKTETSSSDDKDADVKGSSTNSQISNKDSGKTADVSADDSKTNTKDDNSNMAVQGGNTVVQQTTKQEELYDIQDLIANSKALGYKKEVVAGALFNCSKTQMSKNELDGVIKKFLGKKVK